ncbi:hypothetical protein QJS10_CPB11g00433 [Acorus calamus]|uniref:Bifunctional inhibitor/plant lipid transfer protein/seed storage helical domain-containing protein n=1 Tax=Acorus calamus TaxID=4465 RepID=A0AAV9DS90_ACOCL|nr:hypothetical protein QJS10_CPB11g00433 [Acorus calamus]
MGSSSAMAVVLAMALVFAAAIGAEGQSGVPDCASKLVPCASYLNATTKPPESCCGPLTEAVTKELTCLCNLYNNPAIISAFKINITQALALPKLCGLSGNISACKTASGPSSSNPSPPATTGGGSGSGSGSGAAALAGLGGSAVVGLLLFWSALMV